MKIEDIKYLSIASITDRGTFKMLWDNQEVPNVLFSYDAVGARTIDIQLNELQSHTVLCDFFDIIEELDEDSELPTIINQVLAEGIDVLKVYR